MAKKKPEATEQTGLDEINDSLTNLTNKVQDNKKVVMIAGLVVVAIIAIILSYVYFFRGPGIVKANDAIGRADLEMAQGNDSTALEAYRKVADDMSYDAANRAALQSAILLYRQGKYEEALKYADQYSAKDAVVGAAAYSLKGDCLVNLDRLDEAVKAFKEAVRTSDHNPVYTPFFLLKLARVYAAQGLHQDEADTYAEVIREYPLYGPQHNIDVEKYLDRANLQLKK